MLPDARTCVSLSPRDKVVHSVPRFPRCLVIAGLFALSATVSVSVAQDSGESSKPNAGGGALIGGSGETTIYADQQAEFDSKAKRAVFRGNVRVKDAEFFIKCDRLTTYVDEAGEGLSTAEAEGNVRVIQEKRKPDGSKQISTGRGRRLLYDAKTGEAKLMGRPQVQEGINLHIAENDSTVMILRRDGQLKTIGGSRTVINPKNDPEAEEKSTRQESNE